MDIRFTKGNVFQEIKLEDFEKTIYSLEIELGKIKNNLEAELLITTNLSDYNQFGSSTILTQELIDALDRRKRINFEQLSQNLWDNAYKIEYFIKDNNPNSFYMISIFKESEEFDKLFFYGQGLDKKSYEILESIKKKELFQKDEGNYKKKFNSLSEYIKYMENFNEINLKYK